MIHQTWWIVWHIVVFGAPAAVICVAAAYVLSAAFTLDAENRKRRRDDHR